MTTERLRGVRNIETDFGQSLLDQGILSSRPVSFRGLALRCSVAVGMLAAFMQDGSAQSPTEKKATPATAGASGEAAAPQQVGEPAKKAASTKPAPGPAKPGQAGAGNAPDRPGETKLEEEVRAAFMVEPVVHRFDGRKGELIPFEFSLTSQGDNTEIEVRAVALRQEENGVIMPDTDSPPPKAISFSGQSNLSLKAEEPYTLKGTVRVPTTNSSFHSFGLLITDKGRSSQKSANGQVATPQFGVNFVTRYLLRCDINVEGVRPADASKLVLDGGSLLEADGRAQARMYVSNPTESPLEFEMKARLVGLTGGVVGKEFNLISPIRSNMSPPERFVARVLPGARVRLEEFVPFAVFSGDYQLETTLTVHGRKFATAQFPVSVTEKDYPAQAATVAQIMKGISVSPSQVELSLQKGGERFVSVVIANQSTEEYKVNASPQNRDGSAADWFLVRPHEFGLPPGTVRKILVSMPPARDPEAPHQYGRLNFEMSNQAGESRGSGAIDVGLMARTETKPEVEIGSLSWDTNSTPPALVLDLQNKGSVHFPLNASMTISDGNGNRLKYTSGYGRWVLPGDSASLRFRVKETIPAGRYGLKILVETKPGEPSIDVSTPIEIK